TKSRIASRRFCPRAWMRGTRGRWRPDGACGSFAFTIFVDEELTTNVYSMRAAEDGSARAPRRSTGPSSGGDCMAPSGDHRAVVDIARNLLARLESSPAPA